MLASEKNRLHKLLTDAGIRLGVVVSDLHGQSARAMVKALIAGKTVPEVLSLASNRLRASREDIFEALQAEEITPAHRFCLGEIMAHIEELEARIARFDAELLRALHDAGYAAPLRLLQTLPGIDLMGAAMLLVEIGADMGVFGSAQRLGAPLAVRVCTGCGAQPLCAQRQVSGPERAQGAQALDRGAGAQDAAHDLRDAEQEHPLR